MSKLYIDRIEKEIQTMTLEDLKELVLGMCEDNILMRERVINCLDGLDISKDENQRNENREHRRLNAAVSQAWKKWKLAELRQQLQRSYDCIKEAELALGPALRSTIAKEWVKMGSTAPVPLPPIPMPPGFQVPTAHQSLIVGQYPVPSSVPPPPIVTTTQGMPGPIPTIPARILEQPTGPLCKNCNRRYKEASNHPMACRYHPGPLRLDPKADVWSAKGIKEPMDTTQSRWLYPGGFKYECCGEDLVERPGRVNGCATSNHTPARTGNTGDF
ncbi:hypothetical protein Hte_001302 [Hypoxylon texense]